MSITKGSFSGQPEEQRQHPKGPKPAPDDLTAHDRVSTIVHLLGTCAYNAHHSFVHVKEAAKQAAKQPDNPRKDTLQHNIAHAQNHTADVVEHLDKLKKALDNYPGAKSMAQELKAPVPSSKPAPPPGKRVKDK